MSICQKPGHVIDAATGVCLTCEGRQEEFFGLKDDGYDILRDVFAAAVDQAAGGKGRERHASGEPFDEQTILQTVRAHGLGFATGQAEKKARESHKLLEMSGPERAQHELLGAMNYLAAAHIRLGEMIEETKETGEDR